MKYDIITIGGATRDVFFKTNEGKIINDKKVPSGKILGFEYGAKIVPEESYFSYGGGGMNTAVCFAKLGLRVASKINIGNEGTGSLIHKILKEKGVNTTMVDRDKKLHTALSIIVSDNGDRTMFLYRGANDNLKIGTNIENTDWLYVSSLTGESEKILDKLPRIIEKKGLKLAWNPGSLQIEKGARNIAKVLKNTEVLLVNKAEAKELLLKDLPKSKRSDMKVLLSKLQSYGPKTVVITDGKKGSFATDGDKVYAQESLSREAIETTGAGDSYGSTFVAGIIKGYNILESMNLASANAASVVSRVGAQEGLLGFKELNNSLKKSKW